MADTRIAAWQEAVGLNRATGGLRDVLDQISNAAFDLIKIIELGRSGIRDGDGYWCGSQPVLGLLRDFARLEERLMAAYGEGEATGKTAGSENAKNP